MLQLRGDPIHLRTVGGGFLRNHDVAAFRQQTAKAIEHSVRPADDVAAERRVGLIEPAGQTDSAGDGIDLGDGVAGLGQDQIGPNDQRQIVAELFLAGELNQIGGLPGVEVFGDPGRLFAFDAALVKLVAGALENEEPMTELLEFFRERGIDRERIGREEEILFGEKALFGEGGSDRGELVSIRRSLAGEMRGAAR